MALRRLCCLTACLLLVLAFSSCTGKASKSKPSYTGAAAGVHSGLTFASSQNQVADISAEAQKLNSSAGRVALAMIICKLDSSNVMSELAQKNAQELLTILMETASQKSHTLESINDRYDLVDILKSEGIYVEIKSNAVTTQSAPASSTTDTSWIPKFETAINRDSNG